MNIIVKTPNDDILEDIFIEEYKVHTFKTDGFNVGCHLYHGIL